MKTARIIFRGTIIYDKPFAHASFQKNWNNDMGEHYPYVSILLFDEETGKVSFDKVDLYQLCGDVTQCPDLAIIHDQTMLEAYESNRRKKAAEIEASIIRFGKQVEVVSGKKIPIGTRGEVFWMGNGGWEKTVGIRLPDNTRIFSALKNVKAIGDLNEQKSL